MGKEPPSRDHAGSNRQSQVKPMTSFARITLFSVMPSSKAVGPLATARQASWVRTSDATPVTIGRNTTSGGTRSLACLQAHTKCQRLQDEQQLVHQLKDVGEVNESVYTGYDICC
jgi:hypothetical protein